MRHPAQSGTKSTTVAARIDVPRSRTAWLVAVLVGALALLLALVVVVQVDRMRLQEQRRIAYALAIEHAAALQSGIEHALSATYALAALVRQSQGQVPDFDAVATEMLALYPGATGLALAPDGVIRRIVPLAGNERAIGHDLLRDPQRDKEAFLARDTGRLTLAGPFELLQGGVAAAGRLPVFFGDGPQSRFWGFVSVLVRFPQALEPARLSKLEQRGYLYDLWRTDPETGRRHRIAASPGVAASGEHEPVEASIVVPNAVWTLAVVPAAGWGDPAITAASAALGLLFSVLMGFVAKLTVEARAHRLGLQALVQQRTRELAEREADLERAQEVAQIGSWVFDAEGGRERWTASPQTYRILGLPIGSRLNYQDFLAMVEPEDRTAVDRALRSVLDGDRAGLECRVTVDDRQRWLRVKAEMVRLPGRSRRFVGTLQDVTERRQADQALRIAAAAFETQEGILVTDTDAVIQRVNRAFTEITGHPAQQVVGRHVRLLKSGAHDAAFYAAMWDAIRRDGHWEGEVRNRRANGQYYPAWLTVTAVTDGDGAASHYVGTLVDITQRKAAEAEIKHMAFYDPLTLLPNRRLLMDRLQQALVARARTRRCAALLFLDLDAFKALNDTHGHHAGDQLLQQVAHRVSASVREGDTVARLGGDEFVVLLEDLSPQIDEAREQAVAVAAKIRAALLMPYRLGALEYRCGASIGVAVVDPQPITVQEVIRRADVAMYRAKSTRSPEPCVFEPDERSPAAPAGTEGFGATRW